MKGFAADWLALREPADHAARSQPGPKALAASFASRVRARASGAPRILDLAGGAGSNLRFLAPLIGGAQHWTVWDHDPALLDRIPDTCGSWAAQRGWQVDMVDKQLVVTGADLSLTICAVARDLRKNLDFRRHDGIACAALLDLVSLRWCEDLVQALIEAEWPPLLCSLVADGVWRWAPAVAADNDVGALFAADMLRDKGFGAALGYGAVSAAKDLFSGNGLTVELAPSPWELRPGDQRLQEAMLEFCEEAIGRGGNSLYNEWLTTRRDLIGVQKLSVGHCELLASR